MKRQRKQKEETQEVPLEFCTECDHDLDDFAFDEKSKSKKKVQDNFANCRKTGKFKGEFCSKVFISEDEIFLKRNEQE